LQKNAKVLSLAKQQKFSIECNINDFLLKKPNNCNSRNKVEHLAKNVERKGKEIIEEDIT